MRPRPPSLRFRRRYILVEVLPRSYMPDGRMLYPLITEAIGSLWGDAVAAVMQPAVVFCEQGSAIIRCRRGTEQKLGAALATVTGQSNCPIALRALATGGTILGLRRKVRTYSVTTKEGSGTIGGRSCTLYQYGDQKVDVIERGIKGQHLQFLTEQDREEMECNLNTRWDMTGQ